jgi:O-antigen/teichoic acid export membrane protein
MRLRQALSASASMAVNGYALVASSLISSALGVIFWAVAARSFSQAELGIGAALIAVMTPIASAAQFNFKNVIYRFASREPSTQPLLRRLYLASAVAALIIAIGFAAIAGLINPEIALLFQSGWMVTLFIVAVVTWTLFGLQEAVIVALQTGILIPARSLLYAMAKLAMLVALALFSASGLNILVAWTVPALLILLATGLVSSHLTSQQLSSQPQHGVARHRFFSFLGWDYVGTIASAINFGIAPMIVVAAAGAEAGAHFYLAFSVSYFLYLIGSQMGAALMTEHAGGPAKARTLYADALVQTLLPIIPAALLIVALAPYIMSVFGADFVTPGATVLQLLVLGAVPGAAVAVFLAICRTQGWVRIVALLQTAKLLISAPLGLAMSALLGSVGMAIALLLTEMIVVASIVVWAIRQPGLMRAAALENHAALTRALARMSDLGSRWLRRAGAASK